MKLICAGLCWAIIMKRKIGFRSAFRKELQISEGGIVLLE